MMRVIVSTDDDNDNDRLTDRIEKRDIETIEPFKRRPSLKEVDVKFYTYLILFHSASFENPIFGTCRAG